MTNNSYVQRIERIEMLDESELLQQLMEHYCICIAIKDSSDIGERSYVQPLWRLVYYHLLHPVVVCFGGKGLSFVFFQFSLVFFSIPTKHIILYQKCRDRKRRP